MMKRKITIEAIFIIMLMLIFINADQQCFKEASPATQYVISSIQPQTVFIPGTQPIKFLMPANDAHIGPSTPQTFTFDSVAQRGSLLIFKDTAPDAAVLQNSGPDTSCFGGTSSLAGHVWSNTSITVDNTAASQLYACQTGNLNQPLSVSQKMTPSSFAAGIYYWVVLGYDINYVLTHSSPVNKFTVP